MGFLPAPNLNDIVIDKGGSLILRDISSSTRIRLDGATGDIQILNKNNQTIMRLEADGSNIWVGGHGQDGDLVLFSRSAKGHSLDQACIHLNGDDGAISIGGGGEDGKLVLRSRNGDQLILLDGKTADFVLGQHGQGGNIHVQNKDGQRTIDISGNTGNVRLGGSGAVGDFKLDDGLGKTRVELSAKDSELKLNDASGKTRVYLSAGDGELQLSNTNEEPTIHLNAQSGNVHLHSISFLDGSNQSSAPKSAITKVIAGFGLSGGGSSGEVHIGLSQKTVQDIASIESRVRKLELSL